MGNKAQLVRHTGRSCFLPSLSSDKEQAVVNKSRSQRDIPQWDRWTAIDWNKSVQPYSTSPLEISNTQTSLAEGRDEPSEMRNDLNTVGKRFPDASLHEGVSVRTIVLKNHHSSQTLLDLSKHDSTQGSLQVTMYGPN